LLEIFLVASSSRDFDNPTGKFFVFIARDVIILSSVVHVHFRTRFAGASVWFSPIPVPEVLRAAFGSSPAVNRIVRPDKFNA
jgi:hypothetical protein